MPSRPYPRFYSVNDRPVKLALLPDGGVDALVLDGSTGALVPDRSYFARVSDLERDVQSLTEEQFDALVAECRRTLSDRRRSSALQWESTGDGEVPYRALVDGRALSIRVNDFPAEPLYTLLVDGHEVEDLDDWPSAWMKPAVLAGR